jgi:hypothetical protein|tara:strand:+ start:613 stop:876 length:264 start_codon:yes stop_codon:yes gene_type:complete
MGKIERLHNFLVIDSDFASEVWATLQGMEGSLSSERLSEMLALKMYDQDCGFSHKVLDSIGGSRTSDEIIEEWAKPIRKRMKEIQEN